MNLRRKLNILKYNFKRLFFLSFIVLCFGFCTLSLTLAESSETVSVNRKVNSDYCTIIFEGDVDLRKVDKRLDIKFINLSSVNRQELRHTSDLFERIALKCDIILLKAEQTLDMYPADFHVNIIIFENKEMLIDAYEEVFEERKDLYSFYIYENNTIYTTQLRINQNVLAHEMGHALVNHYFIIRPPAVVRELISQYIDIHLED